LPEKINTAKSFSGRLATVMALIDLAFGLKRMKKFVMAEEVR
jgi:hypothetical protein